MTQTDVPLYPKISSIYNKILQLAIAITFIVVLMNILLFMNQRQVDLIVQQQTEIGDQYIAQAARSTLVLLKEKNTSLLKAHMAQLAVPDLVHNTVLYDKTGQTIHQSGEKLTVNELYGIAAGQLDKSDNLQTFVVELRDEKLYGYLRMTVYADTWQDVLHKANEDTQEMLRIMLLIAGITGFLLTRGLSRFSRQGYRVKPPVGPA
jgi:membrane protein